MTARNPNPWAPPGSDPVKLEFIPRAPSPHPLAVLAAIVGVVAWVWIIGMALSGRLT